jgi:hypothetical protein
VNLSNNFWDSSKSRAASGTTHPGNQAKADTPPLGATNGDNSPVAWLKDGTVGYSTPLLMWDSHQRRYWVHPPLGESFRWHITEALLCLGHQVGLLVLQRSQPIPAAHQPEPMETDKLPIDLLPLVEDSATLPPTGGQLGELQLATLP